MPTLTSARIALPIQRATELPSGAYAITPVVLGTCFSIGGWLMLTAGHVAAEIEASPNSLVVVGVMDAEERMIGAKVTDTERLSGDVGLLRVNPTHIRGAEQCVATFRWKPELLEQLSPVKTVGYAMGHYVLEGELRVMPRAFQGYVVARNPRFRPVGMTGEPFCVYELSFPAPVGLSGAPLMAGRDSSTRVAGVVIGNAETELVVYRWREEEREGNVARSVEQNEFLKLGVAVAAEEILKMESRLAGSTIEAHLEKSNLLTAPRRPK